MRAYNKLRHPNNKGMIKYESAFDKEYRCDPITPLAKGTNHATVQKTETPEKKEGDPNEPTVGQ
jgi:hypothetical protein